MTLLDLGRIASHLDTALAHAMLHAVAVAKDSPLRDQINEILATISLEQREELMQWAVDNQPLSE